MKKQFTYIVLLAGLLSNTISCNRYLDITPTGVVTPTTLQDYRDILTTAYNAYPKHKTLLQYRTDEVKMNTNSENAPQVNDLYLWKDSNSDTSTDRIPYDSFYNSIMYINQVLNNGEQLSNSAEKNQLLGEAYALRAMIYFELANIFAPVYSTENLSKPAIVITTKTKLEGSFPKSNLEETYKQIERDIEKAKALINVEKQTVGLNYRFTTVALDAFSARVHLYKGEYLQALDATNRVLAKNNSLENFNNFVALPQSFKSVESIMNLDLSVDFNVNSTMFASDKLLGLYDRNNDLRFEKYFSKSGNNFTTTKYRSNNETKWSFRVSDVLLMKAEALAKLGKENEAKTALLKLAEKRYNTSGFNNFRNKINTISGNDFLTELYNERQRETAFDGLRWYDLRRTEQPQITHTTDKATETLQKNDPRYTIPFPEEAKRRNPLL